MKYTYTKYYIPSKKTGKNRRRRIQIIVFIIFFPTVFANCRCIEIVCKTSSVH